MKTQTSSESGCTLSYPQALLIAQQVLDTEYLYQTGALWAKRRQLHELLKVPDMPTAYSKAWEQIARDSENDTLAITRFTLVVNHLLSTGQL